MKSPSVPTLVVIDAQREYTTPGRPFNLAGIEPSLRNCGRILEHARKAGWTVIHVQHCQDGQIFGRDSEYVDWIPGYEPISGERVIVKSALSAYTNPGFDTALAAAGSSVAFVIGYGSTMCCLATMVDGALFGRRFTFVHDASWARAAGPGFSEADTHRYATAILGIHAKLTTTDELLQASFEQAA